MNMNDLYQKALAFEFLTEEEGIFLFEHAALAELMFVADELRKKQVPHGKVTWQIDRNVNTTNVCIANCKFCNFYRIPGHADAYITGMETYRAKIEENRALVVLAEAEVPKGIAEAFRSGNLGVLDYYKLKNVQADTQMRETISRGDGPSDKR